MLVCQRDAGVDQCAGGEDGPSLFGGGFKGELWEDDGGCVVGEEDVVDVCGGFVDCADDEFTCAGSVLFVLRV